MPFTTVTLKSLIPNDLPSSPRTIGEHVKKRRYELGLTQQQVADMLGVSEWTILNWENDKTEPPVRTIPALVALLGYDPYPIPVTLADRLYAKRRQLGWSIKRAARELGVDEETWAGWELGRWKPTARNATRVEEFLGLST